jgi:hypothetical protein
MLLLLVGFGADLLAGGALAWQMSRLTTAASNPTLFVLTVAVVGP